MLTGCPRKTLPIEHTNFYLLPRGHTFYGKKTHPKLTKIGTHISISTDCHLAPNHGVVCASLGWNEFNSRQEPIYDTYQQFPLESEAEQYTPY
jgi:hypothetical protein